MEKEKEGEKEVMKRLTAYESYQERLKAKRIITNGLIALSVGLWFIGIIYLAYKAV